MSHASDDEALVPRRKALGLLRDAPDKLDLLLRWCPEKDASRMLGGGADSIRSVVARLGTLDRHHYLGSVRRLSEQADPAALPGLGPSDGPSDLELGDCELSELLTRFRHVRAQSTGFLDDLPDDAWDRVDRIVTHWVNHDAAALASLNAMCVDLNKT